VAHSKGVELALDAAKELSSVGIEAEVINLRSLRPLDINTIVQSVVRTNHVISVEQGWPFCGIGSEISASIMESTYIKKLDFLNLFLNILFVFSMISGEAFYHLDAPVIRITGVDVPMPYTKSLEIAALPQINDIIEATKKVLGV